MPRVVNVIKVRYVSATLLSLGGGTVGMCVCERERERGDGTCRVHCL